MRELINAARSKLDRTYHSAQYSEQRIQLQNSLVLDILHGGGAGATEVNGASSLCQWMILTAGPIGAGKSTCLQVLLSAEIQKCQNFIIVDMDDIREKLPESHSLKDSAPLEYGTATQKEAGCIAEIAVSVALARGRSVVVDGSLSNIDWYISYLRDIKSSRPELKIMIAHVTADKQQILSRVSRRAAISGRQVPKDVLRQSLQV
jgi:predicted ABC-type ATPase